MGFKKRVTKAGGGASGAEQAGQKNSKKRAIKTDGATRTKRTAKATPVADSPSPRSPAEKPRTELEALVAGLARRDALRTEALIQADVRRLLLSEPLALQDGDLREMMLESPVGDGRRIDVEVGTTVVEIKRDLRKSKAHALEQLAGYVKTREEQTGQRYVGVLTDGAEWRCYHLVDRKLIEVSTFAVRPTKPDVDGLLMWLEGVMATARGVPPTPQEIMVRLGAGTSAHALDRQSLAALYNAHRDQPSVRMKRTLWARLLTTALGTQFQDSDELFVEHTLLVSSAEIIAHAALGLDIVHLSPAALLSGDKFAESGIHGVIEEDFFDWVLEVPGGERFVRTLARRLVRFNWDTVAHDVLKVLYESVIGPDTRKKLGEYYTPDWLAETIIAAALKHPLTTRVLDPACGSGTFLFHAVRHYIAASEASRRSLPEVLEGLTRHVMGMDLHPVAVALARVTYLLAIGRERIADPRRGEIRVPVYLGDSVQWQQGGANLFTAGHLVIPTDDRVELFTSQLRFPEKILDNAGQFDRLVHELATKAAKRRPGAPIPSLTGVLKRLNVPKDAHATIEATFKIMCRLHDEGRDHIWGYYIRNLARPLWLSLPENRVDLLIGNPPWLAYRHMPTNMQDTFRSMSESRKLWHGAKVATSQDLSGLFVARTIERYLKKDGGRFAFIMPNAVLDRAQFAGFRTGEYPDATEPVQLAFDTPWDLRRVRPHFFPRGAAVVFGTRTGRAQTLPSVANGWSGRVPRANAAWAEVKTLLHRADSPITGGHGEMQSPYGERFFQGATVVPRMLLVVERRPPGPLGIPAGRAAIRSQRSAYEKAPWKDLDALEGVVETEFLRPLYLGESVLPYRVRDPGLALIPWGSRRLMDGTSERIELYPGLADWWRRAEEIWLKNRSSERLTLIQRLDFHHGLSNQLPMDMERVVYGKAGMHIAAARVRDLRAVIDHKLYWATTSREEAHYLCAILNAATVTERVRPLMSYGKDERDIDKYVWQLPIPDFDPKDRRHARLAKLGQKAEAEIAELALDDTKHFAAQRRKIRDHLRQSKTGQAIEQLVAELLG